MKIWHFIAAAVIGAAAVTYATISGNYEISVQLVPPLVNAPCTFGQWWRIPKIPCSLCYCLTGSLSRCISQVACIPSSNATTPTPNANATDMTPESAGNEMNGTDVSASNETASTSTTSTTTTTPDTTLDPQSSPTTTQKPTKLRARKKY